MINVNSASNNQYVNQSEKKNENKTQLNESLAEKQTTSTINTNDLNKTTIYKNGGSPSSISFAEPSEKKNSVNPLVSLLACFLVVGGAMSGAAYNEELFNATKEDLKKTAQFLSQHGLAYDLSISGRASVPEKQDLYSREEKYPQAKLK